jgi:hypothetical protein
VLIFDQEAARTEIEAFMVLDLPLAKGIGQGTMFVFGKLEHVLAFISVLFLFSFAGTGQAIEENVKSLEKGRKQITEKQENAWTSSLKGMQYKLGGELEFEYVDTQDDVETNQPPGHFQLDKFTLMPDIQILDNVILHSLLLFGADRAYASEAYATFSGLPLNSSLKIGLDDRFIYEKPGRKTEVFPLIDTAFARDDEFAITWNGRRKSLYWMLSLSNGLVLGQQAPGEDASYKLLHDNRQIGDMNHNKEFGLGVGWKYIHTREFFVDALVFGYIARLSSDDIDVLQGIAGYGNSESDLNTMYGFSIEGTLSGISLGGKYIRANDGVLDRYGWFVQTSYRIGLDDRKLFIAVVPLIRYGGLAIDLPKTPTDPLTWDRNMTTLALLIEIARGLMLKIEYCLNGETTGGDNVKNDEFLVQMEIKF